MSKVELKLTEWPEGLALLRMIMVQILCAEADSEPDPYTASRLRAVALDFEVGLRVRDEDPRA